MTTPPELPPPPQPPEFFTLTARHRAPSTERWETFHRIISFEPIPGAFFAITESKRRIVLPYEHWELIEITEDES